MMSISEKRITNIVEALCAHFENREAAIRSRSVSPRVRMEYVYINSKMLDGASEVVGETYAKNFIIDIGRGVGYANTKIDAFAETSYKKSKQAIKRKIAEKLYLIDTTPEVLYETKK